MSLQIHTLHLYLFRAGSPSILFKMKFLYMITLVAGATAIALEPRHHQGKGGKKGKGKLNTRTQVVGSSWDTSPSTDEIIQLAAVLLEVAWRHSSVARRRFHT